MTPTSDPTERSMLRETMISTMPVAMIAIPEAWTASVDMLAGWISLPPLETWKASRITARAISMPNRRRSISVCASMPRTDGRAGGSTLPDAGAASATFATMPSRLRVEATCAPGGSRGRR